MIIYLASPYTNGDIAQNIKKVIGYADRLFEMGHTPFIPHLAFLWHLISPKPVSFWYAYDLIWLSFCDALLRLPGESIGADKEVQFAKDNCIPVYYSVGELDEQN